MKITLDNEDLQKPIEKIKIRSKTKKSPKNINKILLFIVAILVTTLLGLVGYVAYKTYKATQSIGLNLNPKNIVAQEDPQLKKDSTGKYTTLMIVGIDTREGNSGLQNTDSIMIASYNYDSNDVTITSIPRDFHVQIDPNIKSYSRINAVYSTYEKKEEGTGLERLSEVVEEVSGIEVQYYAMINYQAFVDLIDTLGGIDVNVENSFTDYMYPLGVGYQTVRFTEGPQTMDGDTALKYARSRHSPHNNEGSDFSRARRQQKVVTAVAEKIFASGLLSPKTIMSMFNILQENIRVSEFTLEDVNVGVELFQEYKDKGGESYSFVLDPSAGAMKLITSQNVVNTGAYAIGPIAGLGKYEDIKQYVNLFYSDPKFYSENAHIAVYNTGLGNQLVTEKLGELREQFPYSSIIYKGTLYNDKEGCVVYINSEEDFNHSLTIIADYLETDSREKPEYLTSKLNGEDIIILLGKEL